MPACLWFSEEAIPWQQANAALRLKNGEPLSMDALEREEWHAPGGVESLRVLRQEGNSIFSPGERKREEARLHGVQTYEAGDNQEVQQAYQENEERAPHLPGAAGVEKRSRKHDPDPLRNLHAAPDTCSLPQKHRRPHQSSPPTHRSPEMSPSSQPRENNSSAIDRSFRKPHSSQQVETLLTRVIGCPHGLLATVPGMARARQRAKHDVGAVSCQDGPAAKT